MWIVRGFGGKERLSSLGALSLLKGPKVRAARKTTPKEGFGWSYARRFLLP